MKLTEQNFQTAVKVGGAVLCISAIASLYLVMRNREVYRDQVRADVVFQQAVSERQVFESLLRELAVKANTDPAIAGIFQRYQLVQTKPLPVASSPVKE